MNKWFLIVIGLLLASAAAQELHKTNPTICGDCMEKPAAWYGSQEAIRIADNFLLYQRHDGGWPKNIRMAEALPPAERAKVIDEADLNDCTIDNSSTYTQLRFLARVYDATHREPYHAAFDRGLDYLLRAQYPNGGWPQYFPLRSNYSRHITFNDDAMIGVLDLLFDIDQRQPPFAFVDAGRTQRAGAAVSRGVQLILKTQVRVNGRLTAWCAQYDETTLAPASARAYELVSLSGDESVGVVRFLMRLPHPDAGVRRAIEAAVAWFQRSAIEGQRIEDKPDPAYPEGYDRVIVRDPKAPPLWARFYEIETNRPFFCGRDGVKRYDLKEVEHERRAHYSWMGTWAAGLLSRDYPAWQKSSGQGQ